MMMVMMIMGFRTLLKEELLEYLFWLMVLHPPFILRNEKYQRYTLLQNCFQLCSAATFAKLIVEHAAEIRMR